MAEAIAVIGVIAAAGQFSDTGSKLVSRLISLVSKIRDSPQCIQSTIEQVRMLLSLAELTKRKIAQENSAWLPTQAPSPQDEQTTSLQLPQLSPLTWLESVWQNCSAQACELDDLVNRMLQKAESNPFRKGWRKLCTLKSEEQIERILNRIERYKTLLTTCYGQETLDQVRNLSINVIDLHEEMSDIRQTIVDLNETVQRLTPANALGSHEARSKSLEDTPDNHLLPSSEQALILVQHQSHEMSEPRQHAEYIVSLKLLAFFEGT